MVVVWGTTTGPRKDTTLRIYKEPSFILFHQTAHNRWKGQSLTRGELRDSFKYSYDQRGKHLVGGCELNPIRQGLECSSSMEQIQRVGTRSHRRAAGCLVSDTFSLRVSLPALFNYCSDGIVSADFH